MTISADDVEIRERLTRVEARLEVHEQATGKRLDAMELTLDRLRSDVHSLALRVATIAALASAGGSIASTLLQSFLQP